MQEMAVSRDFYKQIVKYMHKECTIKKKTVYINNHNYYDELFIKLEKMFGVNVYELRFLFHLWLTETIGKKYKVVFKNKIEKTYCHQKLKDGKIMFNY